MRIVFKFNVCVLVADVSAKSVNLRMKIWRVLIRMHSYAADMIIFPIMACWLRH